MQVNRVGVKMGVYEARNDRAPGRVEDAIVSSGFQRSYFDNLAIYDSNAAVGKFRRSPVKDQGIRNRQVAIHNLTPLSNGRQANRSKDYRAFDQIFDLRIVVKQIEAVADEGDEDDAGDRPPHSANASVDARSAKDDCRNRGHLQSCTRLWLTGTHKRYSNGSRYASSEATQCEDNYAGASNPNT
jgi:hypothetical protein